MQNKLDPRQYNPYALDTPSGNLSFVQKVASFDCYLRDTLTGDFNISGSLAVNGGQVLSIPTSNAFGGTNVSIFNSVNSFATGSSNSIVGSNNSEISGQNNIILGGANNQVADADNAAVLGGLNTIAAHTGASILGDGDNNREKRTVERFSLTVDFASGLFIQNDAFVNGSLYVTGGNTILQDFYVGSSYSGTFSGDLHVLGNAYHTGSPYQDLQNLLDASGTLRGLAIGASGNLKNQVDGLSGAFNSKLSLTGGAILSINLSTSGALVNDYDAKLGFTVKTTGNQTVDGRKHFTEGTSFHFISGRDIQSTGRFIIGSGRAIPTVFNSPGVSGQISWTPQFLYVCTGNNAWGKIAITNF